jgi:hypothetical protein
MRNVMKKDCNVFNKRDQMLNIHEKENAIRFINR